MDKGSTLYDYTRSAEELRAFELGETCSRIIHEYEMFNLQNDVYKMFGEWLLNEAKTKYSARFTSCDLLDYLESKGLSCPRSFDIEAEYKDRDNCKPFRMLSSVRRFNSSRPFRSDYGRYTLWKIAQAYNCKNGCVVTKIDPGSYIVLDWSKEAQDCITQERWRDEAKTRRNNGMISCGLFLSAIVFILSSIIFAIFGFEDGKSCLYGFFTSAVVFAIWILIIINSLDLYMNDCAENFITHCKNIEDARESRYSIENDRVTY